MTKFLKSALHISWFQALLIAAFSMVKYFVNRYHLSDNIYWPLMWIGIMMSLLLITGVDIMGIIESKGFSLEEWQVRETNSAMERRLGAFAGWAFTMPIVFGYVLLFYLFTPTSLQMLLALYIGIVIRNLIEYFKR